MGKIDEELKAYIALTLRDTVKDLFGPVLTSDKKEEVWLNKAQTKKQFGFSETFMKQYGEKLPRTKPEGGGWVYPRNLIQQMMWSGEIKNLTK